LFREIVFSFSSYLVPIEEIRMKTQKLLAGLAILLITLGAGIQDYLTEMKTTMKHVEGYVQDNMGYGNFVYPSACARIPNAHRAAIVRAAWEFARSFTTTAAFASWYNEFRDQRKPGAPTPTPSMAESRAEQIASMKKQIAETEKNASSAPASQQGLFNDILTALKSSLKEVEGADKSKDAEMEQMIVQMNAAAKKEYADKLAEFEREYPKGDPRPLIRRRLEAFLEKTKGVDFGAKLVKKEKIMVFANAEYENKPGEWKLAFRAGKEATETSRTFANDWLKSLASP
jgi:hypothetical protein